MQLGQLEDYGIEMKCNKSVEEVYISILPLCCKTVIKVEVMAKQLK